MLPLLLMTAAALAIPDFELSGVHPRWAPFAEEAWAHAARCTGHDAPHAPTVRIEEIPLRDLGGLATRDHRGLTRIELGQHAWGAQTLLHEIGHAWFYGDTMLVSEGGTELLADCIAVGMERPELRGKWPLAPQRPTGPLASWGRDAGIRQAWQHQLYAGAYVYMRALLREVPLADLYAGALRGSWDAFRSHLGDRGPVVEAILDFADVSEPVPGLLDLDGDGLPAFYEQITRTDPHRPDTDGDGLLDSLEGLSLPAGAVVLPADGVWHCSGWRIAPPPPAAPPFVGIDRIGLFRAPMAAADAELRVVRGTGEPMWLWMDAPGRPDRRCHESPGLIVLRQDRQLPEAAIRALQAEFVGNPALPVLAELGGPHTRVRGEHVIISSDVLRQVQRSGRYDALAALIEILGGYVDMGLAPDAAQVTDALNIAVGEGVLSVKLAP